ncbi:transglycosylase SLT domain-containing protein [Mesorhizobium sp. ANAO-SY3R2]|uniref:transglycosylase SLT domain-containing protein n=1 Tax=Mesorhizobium sp. ANAO-SY3R2 TaxID=3166644 RepID=UPI0036717527
MPVIKTQLLITAAFSVALLSGCQTNTAVLSTDLSTGTDVAVNATSDPTSVAETDVASASETNVALVAEADLALPETVAVVPVSYAATESAPASAILAAATAAPEAPAAAAAAPVATAQAQTPAAQATETITAPSTVAAAVAAPAAGATAAAAKSSASGLDAPMAGGEVVAAADAPKLEGEFPPAPTIAEYALPAKAPVPRSYQVASLGNVALEDFSPASFAAPDSPALASRGKIDELISKYAALYEVPEQLVRRVVSRESTFNPQAYSRGHWGLMQIKHSTARGMGYDGPANGLLDAETNLKFAVKYLRGAWLVADGDEDRADKLYQSGYYYHAKRKGLLDETGLGRDRARHRG